MGLLASLRSARLTKVSAQIEDDKPAYIDLTSSPEPEDAQGGMVDDSFTTSSMVPEEKRSESHDFDVISLSQSHDVDVVSSDSEGEEGIDLFSQESDDLWGRIINEDLEACKPDKLEEPGATKHTFMGTNPKEFVDSDVIIVHYMQENETDTQAHDVGWEFMGYGRNESRKSVRTYYRSCLGVFHCPQCNFVARPEIPQRRQRGALPRPCEAECTTHKCNKRIPAPPTL
ncbi:hypothetical protein DFQ27_001343 [Actinomortierella ambigua]|uniref:Uncharacterized protein n=1 Tax=Actinomortierella ambigua TaxID=1343610 RepID=A0A9P6QDG1_9FUNG|nr:hypothetical protein DFQ27_001343 [Actinomortierella ambigua]